MKSLILKPSIPAREGSIGSTLYTTPVLSDLRTKYRTDRWRVYSSKLKRKVTLYGTTAYQHWLLIESDPEVEVFCEQPLKIRIRLPQGIVTTTFDIWIRWKSGREEFRAIRTQYSEIHSTDSKQVEAQKMWCSLKGIDHTVVTAETIRSNPIYLSNCKLIQRYLASLDGREVNKSRERILSLVSARIALTSSEVINAIPEIDGQYIFAMICQLIVSGEIDASIKTKLLTRNTNLEVASC